MHRRSIALCLTLFGAAALGLLIGSAKVHAQTPPAPGRQLTEEQRKAAMLLGVDPPVPKKHVLILGFAEGWHHGSISDAMGAIWQLGVESGAWESEIRTDTKWLTKAPLGSGEPHNLDWYDAIVAVNTSGTWQMTDQQKKDFISAIHDDGKGFVAIHAAIDANHNHVWPEYTEMLGGELAGHPWVQFWAPVVIEDPSFPGMRHFATNNRMVIWDEMYVPRSETWSRDKVNVLMRLDEDKLPAEMGEQEPFNTLQEAYRAGAAPARTTPLPPRTAAGRGAPAANAPPRDNGIHADKDYALAWSKMYGKGRVFYSSFGHTKAAMLNPDVRKMYLEAIKWTLGLNEGSTATHPKRN